MYSKLSYAVIQLKFLNIKFMVMELRMISEDLLKIIACPETKQDLVMAAPDLVDKINSLIEKGELVSRSGQKIGDKIDGGLIQKEERKYLYPIRDDIPILLIDESISLDSVS